MERLLRLKKGREILWHPRKKLHSHLYPTTYTELHPNLPLKQAIKKQKQEQLIYDIQHDSTVAHLQRLEIKHLTGEK